MQQHIVLREHREHHSLHHGQHQQQHVHDSRPLSLETLPLECIQAMLVHLSTDCLALHAMLLLNKTWFKMVAPFLYQSPMALIDATWPKLSQYCQVLKKEPLQPPTTISQHVIDEYIDIVGRESTSRSMSSTLPTESHNALSTSSLAPGVAARAAGVSQSPEAIMAPSSTPAYGERMGRGTETGTIGSSSRFMLRTQSRSSSQSSTRSLTVDGFHNDRHEAVHERDRLIKKKKLQVLWLLLNCTITDQEFEEALSPLSSAQDTQQPSESSTRFKNDSFMTLERKMDLDISVDYFKPATDYLSLYTHCHHPGLRFFIWILFPSIDDAALVELRLITHKPERIRELYLESVQLHDIAYLVPRLTCLYRIRMCHEVWDIQKGITFMKKHNAEVGTVRMLELEAYLPDTYGTTMEDDVSDLIASVDHLRTLELSGFETLRADLARIPRAELKVLRLNCGSLTVNPSSFGISTSTTSSLAGVGGIDTMSQSGSMSSEDAKSPPPTTVCSFLSGCRKLEELFLKAVDEDMLGWAVKERREFQATQIPPSSNSHVSPPKFHANNLACGTLAPLKIIELSGVDSEHVAMTISQAAEAFRDTLEVIKANSYSYQSNRTLTSLSWKAPLPRLQMIKIVGRSNLPFDFRSLQYCPALRVLDISKYSGMRACSEALLLNMKYLTKLEYLGLSSFDHLADSTVRTILSCMPRLKHLRLALKDTPTWNMSGSSTASSSGSSAMATASIAVPPDPSSSSSPMSSAASSVQERSSSTTSTSSSAITSGMRMTGMTGDLSTRLNFAAMSLVSQSPAPTSSSTTSSSSSPSPMQSSQQQPQAGYRPSVALPPPPTHLGSSSISTLRPSLLDRFQMENSYLSLEGILEAIQYCPRLEKLSTVLPKIDFEENFHHLEMYNLQHPELEIVVYRYAHAV
ncbi:hypothetical protein BG004_004288 [Podila humilis]|nr:hypothetical protein BG004_004288 [Podila humilis]